jgi:hypothetical protein
MTCFKKTSIFESNNIQQNLSEMRPIHYLPLIVLILMALECSIPASGQIPGKAEKAANARLHKWTSPVVGWHYPAILKIDSITVKEPEKVVNIWFPAEIAFNPIREDNYASLEGSLKEALGRKFRKYSIRIYSDKSDLEQLIPNYYRSLEARDTSRLPLTGTAKPFLVRRVSGVQPSKGLNGRFIALWHSHGYYFDMPLDRWEWQRAKLFGSVEDLSVMAYVVPYLVPMLENSGATVFIPRERDIQLNEVITDNDISTGNSEFIINSDDTVRNAGPGFLLKDTLFSGENPFRMGTSVRIFRGNAVYVPDIPEKGYYAVNISYPRFTDNSGDVRYTVRHAGGSTEFVVNQTIGGGTWLYLGTFLFNKGKDQATGSVTVSSDDGGMTALDAVRFGGGMGNVARRPAPAVLPNQRSLNAGYGTSQSDTIPLKVNYHWRTSGKPRYYEGARYWLQYAGMPDTLVYSPNRGRNDYNDDYMSRAEWVNFLMSSPDTGRIPGQGIPLDLSFAFHTDAGITPGDSIIGTLGIYSTATGNGRFPDGTSRLASRDLTDIIQTQVVNDISASFNPDWTRRGMWDRVYYEARKPNVPAMLMELLSHQNQADQRYGFDPRFRFLVSRAVYKGMLRYLSDASGSEYVVEPLPVTHMALTPLGGKRVRLSWQPVNDPLEPAALPASYRIYTRAGDNGFDNGREVTETYADIELPAYDTIFSFRVTAVNEGGESFPSEVLAAGFRRDTKGTVIVVNCFDRISGPAWFDRGGMAGVEWWNDHGVADHYNFVSTGDQYDFYRRSPWTDDDNPGWGASYSDNEGKIIAGNTFDFPYLHGCSVMAAGRSFVSVSDEVFNTDDFNLEPYCTADIILGEEKTTVQAYDSSKKDFRIYSPEFIHSLERMSSASMPVFVSGSYPGTDLQINGDTLVMSRVKELLHFTPRTGHAVKSGDLYATDIAAPEFAGMYIFNMAIRSDIYAAEAPDAIEPAGKDSYPAFRYTENNTSAGVIYRGPVRTVVLGFPFETIIAPEERNDLMNRVLNFLQIK